MRGDPIEDNEMGDSTGAGQDGPVEESEIAIVGMAGRFPKAKNLAEFWQNLCAGIESISFFTDEEVLASGVDPARLEDPHYVKAGGSLEDVDQFDANFFGFYPREAAIMDPQQRIFLECAWEALENAGYDPDSYSGWIAVYAGASMNTYLIFNLIANREIMDSVHGYLLTIGNDKDFLPTRVSYKLNLRGPSVNVQTACSTSLVAVHLACQSLARFECEMALAGGVAIRLPQKQGYLYQEGGIASPDGHCRAFDAEAHGTVGGDGVGIVVLKRLADALSDGDTIHAVIKGSAINNDGSVKVGYTAPSVDGQAAVIDMALEVSGVEPETISYIEAHGTGTAMGDPIEITALSKVFRTKTQAKGFCGIGSVKTNIGHLDAAAGVTSLIKTALALEHRIIPPSLHFNHPNPKIDFANSPFYVNARLSEWKSNGGPRRAGVSSFGIGGTNVHVILEEAPPREESGPSRSWQLLTLSARTVSALDTATANLAGHLRLYPELCLADVAFTSQVGRKAFENRRIAVCLDVEDAIDALENQAAHPVYTAVVESTGAPVAFMFTGQGAQYVDMARDLYQEEPLFREQVDRCAELLKPDLGLDLRDTIFPQPAAKDAAAEMLKQTVITQPALFVIEYALSKLWMSWGIQPESMVGHSIGEYVAACLAGVFSLKDALALVAARGRLMQSLPGGAMLSVPLAEEQVRPYLSGEVSLAAVNAPELCVLSGPFSAIDELEKRLGQAGVYSRRLFTSHAFHSGMMDPILAAFKARVAEADPQAPKLPFISNVTGTWITPQEATDPGYWARHLRQTVRFASGIEKLIEEPARILLEVGPGRTLNSLAKAHPAVSAERTVLSTVRHPNDPVSDVAFLLTSLGRLWLVGVKVDWEAFHAGERCQRLPLPTYPFERQRYWVEPQGSPLAVLSKPTQLRKLPSVSRWFYFPTWKRAILDPRGKDRGYPLPERWLVFTGRDVLSAVVVKRLVESSHSVTTVQPGSRFTRQEGDVYTLNPAAKADYFALVGSLQETNRLPDAVLHLWNLAEVDPTCPEPERIEESLASGLYSLLYLAQAFEENDVTRTIPIWVVSSQVHNVTGDESLAPEKAALLGAVKVIPQEYPNLSLRSIDIGSPFVTPLQASKLAGSLLREMAELPAEPIIAYRGGQRWVQTYEPLPFNRDPGDGTRLRKQGVYLITGGLGRIGLALAGTLARSVQARLVLVDRVTFPARSEWDRWLEDHDDQHPTSRRITNILSLEESGAEVLVATADVANLSEMQSVIERARSRFGALTGVIHAAGLVGEQSIRAVQETGPAECIAQFQPKMHGLRVLEAVLQGEELDFCFLQSSLSAVLGGVGLLAYSAANLYMDAFAEKHNQSSPVPWTSVNWDGWRFAETAPTRTALAELSLTPEEGVQAFQRLMSFSEPYQIVVSTADLDTRLKQWVRHEQLHEGASEPQAKKGSLHPRPRLRTAFVEPRNELETSIAGMWEKVLGIEGVGVLDDFFELGGHSLLATQLVSRLRDTYQVELPLPKLFETPTIAGLTGLIETARKSTLPAPVPPIQPVSRSEPLPLSFGQQRLWFLDQLEPESPLYNNFSALKLTGSLNVAALEGSLNEIVRRHEILRTSFQDDGGQPVQVISETMEISINRIDLSNLPKPEQDAEVFRLALEEARLPFNLKEGPLVRVSLVRLGSEEHVIFLTMHHIVSDGWSVGVLIQEVGFLYTTYVAGGSQAEAQSALPELPVQYADYAVWQRRIMQGENLEAQIDYWRKQLRDAPGVLELPTDRPRPAIQSSNGASLWFEIPQGLSDALAELSRQEGVTSFMMLLAALQTLLYRYTGQEDISVGTPIANRNRAETEGLIGFILNTLVMRTDLSGNPSFRGLLQQVRDVALGAYAHPDLPFEVLVEDLQPRRNMGVSPLFQVIFDLQVAPLHGLELPGVTIQPLKVDSGTSKFDLALSMEEDAGGRLSGFFNYNTDLFDPGTISRLSENFLTLLEGIAAHPEQHLSELPLLTAGERRRILEDWNGAITGELPSPLVHTLFESQVERDPDALAVVLGEQQLSYQELDRRANRLANYLKRLGVGPESLVGVCLERNANIVSSVLGIFKAGGALLPLDPAFPKERLEFMIQDGQVGVILTQERLLRHLSNCKAEIVCVDRDWDEIARESSARPETGPEPQDLAYVIYTSGSTGKPKGVMVEHGTFANHCRDVRRHFGIESGDRVFQFASLNFDPALEQIFTTLTVGATLYLRADEVEPVEDFHRKVIELQLTEVNLPPAYWRQWLQFAARSGEGAGFSKLKLVIAGGDVVQPEDLELWRQTPMRHARLLNAYGPTETTITATTFEVPQSTSRGAVSWRVPIGRPLPNRKVYILDQDGNPVPVGVAGHLHLGGAGLARGYLHQSELTAQKFIADPFSSDPGARLYQTGDLARYLPGGEIVFLGRFDSQVKLRGMRVELGEIEAALAAHPSVQDVAVMLREDEPGDQRLVAYAVCNPDRQPTGSELVEFIKEKLPAYMVPTTILFLDELPLLISGKVDRKALPAPDPSRKPSVESFVAPRGPVEEEISRVWSEVIGVERVGANDNFFDLGGHSLLATQIISRLREHFQVDLPLRQLFETPTVAGIAAMITQSLIDQEQEDELDKLLADLEGLSDEDVQRLLNDEKL